jgi:hypothetical protein
MEEYEVLETSAQGPRKEFLGSQFFTSLAKNKKVYTPARKSIELYTVRVVYQ